MSENEKINVIEIEPYCYDFLTEKTLAAISTRTQSLLHQYNVPHPQGWVRQVAPVMFLGYMCTAEEVSDTVEILASKLNLLAEHDFILASLQTMIVVPMVDPVLAFQKYGAIQSIGGKRMYAVLSYVAIVTAGEEYIKKHMAYLSVKEGGVPFTCSNEVVDQWENTSTYAISEE